ncbi:RecQ family ATP-dependent DNA helicase [Thalassomonas viridans]|uniref:ATP-dependent DNA helicase RecQ n=1 Tax=Thalassomonas viridans TaxID=137584 RepID=A0AAF0CAI7_9GAMM|nr:RecQ family ATP-dependent DNA helicase [Thalassomonas viridans]WDE05909.1 RecQ family ATP-dependent DNA helicase [Thalassomonas viridans]
MTTDINQLLQTHFGYQTFRPGQAEVIRTIVSGRSAAAIFPTGAGKSLCYQLPALCLPHVTLVVSPLLALMKDQLEFLQAKGIAAASIDSAQSKAQALEVMNRVRSGDIKILMISVERLNNERFRQFIAGIRLSLLVVDEAHCISEWGHNFRPDYLKLPVYMKELAIPQVLLLTATATTAVIRDMGNKLGVRPEDVTLTGFYRPNLDLAVMGVSQDEKLTALTSWLEDKYQLSGIVYVTLQQSAELLAGQLKQKGIAAQAYHAGMSAEDRQQIQQEFMSGDTRLIIATIAFGMGIDKSDIRYVVHYDLPKSIENYAQEIGRAGRDGLLSHCLVLANADNLNVLENFVYGDTPEQDAIGYVLDEIRQQQGEWQLVLNALSNDANIRLLSLKTLLVYLELFGVIKPAYSYFAEYKFKLTGGSEQQLAATFNGERADFIRALLHSCDKARTWYTVNFDRLQQIYPSDRQRVLTALEYLDGQGLIELQAKTMTQVYQVLNTSYSMEQLQRELAEKFADKEQNEIQRIHQLLAFFAGDSCLSRRLGQYFADEQLKQNCGHCSVCRGQVALLPETRSLAPLESFDFAELSGEIREKLAHQASSVLISRFLCGLTTPVFTRLRVRKLKGFARLEQYRFARVKAWVEAHMPE